MTSQKEAKAPKAGEIIHKDEKAGVIYVVHPVTPEMKKRLSRQGKIIDAKFAPKK